jgi:hypothetical protein
VIESSATLAARRLVGRWLSADPSRATQKSAAAVEQLRVSGQARGLGGKDGGVFETDLKMNYDCVPSPTTANGAQYAGYAFRALDSSFINSSIA